jgi:hypothetical protein
MHSLYDAAKDIGSTSDSISLITAAVAFYKHAPRHPLAQSLRPPS